MNTPSDAVFLIANEYSLLHTRPTFDTEFFRDENKALTPPYSKMGEIRFNLFHDLKRCDVGRKGGGGNMIPEILCSIDGITPKRRGEARVSKHCLSCVFKSANVVFDFTILSMCVRDSLLESDTSVNKVCSKSTLDKFEGTISTNGLDTVARFSFPSGCDGLESGDSMVFLFDKGCTSEIGSIIKDGPEVFVALGSDDGKRAAGIHMQEVADISGAMSKMGVWSMWVFVNQARNAVRGGERPSINNASGIVFGEECFHGINTNVAKPAVP
jgi:hypothetical protein